MALYRHWAGTISSAVLFGVIFASQVSGFEVMKTGDHGAAFGLLLFLLPGIVGSLLLHENKIINPIVGALIASPFCLLLFYLGHGLSISLWYQLAYMLSAVFWCACGALGCYFAGVIYKGAAH
ncbi:inner membrane protein YbjM [Sodalis sp. RH24]|uniref:inner membrane protein YbjM n=1 Tax=unclassified Sodalis (in: enterobacteria) TaxID=2636512 RepID=UPI00396597E4